MSVLYNRLGFALTTAPRGDSHQRVARFECVSCLAAIDVNLKSGETISPEHIAKRAAREGWITDPSRQNKTLCPDCQKPKRQPANTEPEMPAATPIPLVPKPSIATTLTSEQRVKVRGYLDKHFDDSIGLYLDGMSDQKIAEALDVPRILIDQMREAAYGPIRINPEMAAMRTEMFDLKQEIANLTQRAIGIETRLGKLGG